MKHLSSEHSDNQDQSISHRESSNAISSNYNKLSPSLSAASDEYK